MLVNITDAKNNMAELMRLLETGEEKEIIVCKHGKPMVRWMPFAPAEEEPRPFGLLKEKYPDVDPNHFFDLDEEIALEFEGN